MPEINSDIIDFIQSKLNEKNRCYELNEAYVKGKNPEILTRDKKKDPDNRVPIPLAKSSIEDMTGYAARPGAIVVKIENKGNGDEDPLSKQFNDIYKQFADHNTDNLEITELYIEGNSQGIAYELWWTSEALNIPGIPITAEWKIIPGNMGYPIWSKSLKTELEKFCYFYKDEFKNEVVIIYQPLFAEMWVKPENKDKWIKQDEIIEYPFQRVPVAIFPTNKDYEPLFESEKAIIKQIDELMSNSSNEIDRFNALIALLPVEVQKEFVDKLTEYKVIDELQDIDGDKWPRYLEKNLGGVTDFYNQLADRLERFYHKTIKIPDMTDEAFAGNQSGVAIAFKLIGMEFKAALIEAYFNKGFADREKLFFDLMEGTTSISFDREMYKFCVDSQRYLPVDVEAKLRTANQMAALGISKQTILKFIPNDIIDNVGKELERMEKQREENMALIQDSMSGENKQKDEDS